MTVELAALVAAGARLHQTGCNGCIGMGQAPAVGRNSLRTTPRNFPGRSGTEEDLVFLCSPETATASALAGRIADPRKIGIPYPMLVEPTPKLEFALMERPLPLAKAKHVDLVKGSNIHSLPDFDPLPDKIGLEILLKIGDDVSTDEILPAGAKVLPYRSNLQRISDFAFERIDPDYARRARARGADAGHAVIAGNNYGQGSSREHAAAAPRYLGLRVVIAKSFARIHRQNLINYGVLPLLFANADNYDLLDTGDELRCKGLRDRLADGSSIVFKTRIGDIEATHSLTTSEIAILLDGGVIAHRRRLGHIGEPDERRSA